MKEDTQQIKEKFMKLVTRQDVAELLGIKDKSLRYFLYGIKTDKMYYEFKIQKKNGGERCINAPDDRLKNIQRKLAHILNCVYEPKSAAHGFVLERNIITNAQRHVKKKYVFNLDLENFFDQVHFGRVRGMLMKPPYGIGAEAALVIAQIACYKGKLPQGAPTSPILTNMVCAPLDTQLIRLAQKYKLHYTRYADDISFSSYREEIPPAIVYVDYEGVHIGKELREKLEQNSFVPNEKKTRMFDCRKRQEVTGLVVNQFVNIKREYIKKVRAMLFQCRNDKIYQAAERYIELGNCKNKQILDLIKNKSDESKEQVIDWFKSVLKGKINYIGEVKGKNNKVFLKYATELNKICNEEIIHLNSQMELLEKIEKSVFVIEHDGNGSYCQGSGFILKNVGLLTNYHVTEENEIYNVFTCKSEKVTSLINPGNLLACNREIDYACYNWGGQSEDALLLGNSKNLKIGDKVIIIGYPNYCVGNSPEIQSVDIISVRKFMKQDIYTVSGRVVHGASGGVVLNLSYEVVGVIRCGMATTEELDSNANQGFIPIHDIVDDLKKQKA